MKLFYILIICLGFVACKSEGKYQADKVPSVLLSKDQMTDILTDLTILESAYQNKYIQVSRYSYLLIKDADSIFLKHGTNKLVFDENMVYYSSGIEDLATIYQEVKNRIENLRNTLPYEENQQDTVDKTNNEVVGVDRRLPFKTEEDIQNVQGTSN
ncbi:MAG: DUF4296 domain-containing protein [Crocinitomicaceae bacterium]|nr:DUF4296 domain-containing protein [Crocinitomicaceae bacterium]